MPVCLGRSGMLMVRSLESFSTAETGNFFVVLLGEVKGFEGCGARCTQALIDIFLVAVGRLCEPPDIDRIVVPSFLVVDLAEMITHFGTLAQLPGSLHILFGFGGIAALEVSPPNRIPLRSEFNYTCEVFIFKSRKVGFCAFLFNLV